MDPFPRSKPVSVAQQLVSRKAGPDEECVTGIPLVLVVLVIVGVELFRT